jgi:hypothetical protein
MSKEHLTTLWKWLTLACFVYVVGSVITIQGGVDIFGAKFLADRQKDGLAVLAYFSVVIGSVLMSLALTVAILYARRHGRSWHGRIPVVMLKGMRTESIEGKIFQVLVVIVLVVVPIVGIVRSMVVANQGAICEQVGQGAAPIFYPGGQWKLIALPSAQNQLRLMTRDTQAGNCGGAGVEIGWYTPIGFGLFPLLHVVLLVVWLSFVFRPGPRVPGSFEDANSAPEK